ncbi:MAG: hypothetical protein AB1758_14265, partial [Candidatus Eremiobacterota bacterium]
MQAVASALRPVASVLTLVVRPAPERVEADRFAPSSQPEVHLMPVNFTRSTDAEVLEELKRHMARWPTLKATVAFGPDGNGNTASIVAGRPEDASATSLQGMHEVLARLASSPSIKYAARRYPVSYQPARPVGPDAVKVRLPGPMDAPTLNQALSEGFQANPRELGVTLPPGRVALLVGGPSGAGKTTLSQRVGEMLGGRR